MAEPSLLINRRGQEISVQDSAAPIRDRGGRLIGVVMVFHDVSQERRLQRALSYQATHDALTGLINRREFEHRLNEALHVASARSPTLRHVVMFLDLDQFKVVNDTCGHQAGDRLLKQITSVLQTRVRTSDTLARLGGDEFGVLLQDCTLEMAQRIAEELRQAIRDFRFVWQDRVMNVGVSIGLAEMSGEHETLSTIMSAADVACYLGQGIRPQPRAHVQRGPGARAAPRNAVGVAHQPRLRRGTVRAVLPADRADPPRRRRHAAVRAAAAHARRNRPARAAERVHPGGRAVQPDADDRPLGGAPGVPHTRAPARHRRGDRAPYCLTINVSTTTINDEQFLDYVIAEMAAAEVSPGALCFELTETTAMTSLVAATHFIRELRKRGVRFSLDDFGSGLSSFMFLKNLPVDYVKIDGQFVHNVAQDAIDRSMVDAITQIAGAMGIGTIAERVDSAEVLEQLAIIGVQYAQGHYVASPQPVEVLQSILTSPAGAGEVDRKVG